MKHRTGKNSCCKWPLAANGSGGCWCQYLLHTNFCVSPFSRWCHKAQLGESPPILLSHASGLSMRIWCGPFSRLTWHFNNLLRSNTFSSAVLPWLPNWYFWIGPGPPGAQKQPKGPYWGHPQEKQNRRPQSHRNILRFTLWIFRIHQRSGNGVSSSGLRPLSAVFQNAFRLGHPQNWPESPFRSSNPTIIWEKGNLGIFQIDA